MNSGNGCTQNSAGVVYKTRNFIFISAPIGGKHLVGASLRHAAATEVIATLDAEPTEAQLKDIAHKWLKSGE